MPRPGVPFRLRRCQVVALTVVGGNAEQPDQPEDESLDKHADCQHQQNCEKRKRPGTALDGKRQDQRYGGAQRDDRQQRPQRKLANEHSLDCPIGCGQFKQFARRGGLVG